MNKASQPIASLPLSIGDLVVISAGYFDLLPSPVPPDGEGPESAGAESPSSPSGSAGDE